MAETMFNFARSRQTAFRRGCSALRSDRQWAGVPVAAPSPSGPGCISLSF